MMPNFRLRQVLPFLSQFSQVPQSSSADNEEVPQDQTNQPAPVNPSVINRLAQLEQGGGGIQSVQPNVPPPGNTNVQPPMAVPSNRLSSLQNQTPIMDAYRDKLLGPQPNRADFKPSWGRSLLNGLAGSNADDVQKLNDMPFNRAQGDYDNRVKQLDSGGGLEEKSLTNRRMLQGEEDKNTLGQGQLALATTKEGSEAQGRLATQLLNNARTFKIMHPDFKFETINGQVTAVNPADPNQSISLGDAKILTPEAQQQLLDLDTAKSNTIQKRQLTVGAANNKLTQDRELAVEDVRSKNAATREAANIKLRANSKSTLPKAPSINDYKSAHQVAINELMSDPNNNGLYKELVAKPGDVINGATNASLNYKLKDPNDIIEANTSKWFPKAGDKEATAAGLAKYTKLLTEIDKKTKEVLQRSGKVSPPSFSSEEVNDDESSEQ